MFVPIEHIRPTVGKSWFAFYTVNCYNDRFELIGSLQIESSVQIIEEQETCFKCIVKDFEDKEVEVFIFKGSDSDYANFYAKYLLRKIGKNNSGLPF